MHWHGAQTHVWVTFLRMTVVWGPFFRVDIYLSRLNVRVICHTYLGDGPKGRIYGLTVKTVCGLEVGGGDENNVTPL